MVGQERLDAALGHQLAAKGHSVEELTVLV
jgi:hypothetical protein